MGGGENADDVWAGDGACQEVFADPLGSGDAALIGDRRDCAGDDRCEYDAFAPGGEGGGAGKTDGVGGARERRIDDIWPERENAAQTRPRGRASVSAATT